MPADEHATAPVAHLNAAFEAANAALREYVSQREELVQGLKGQAVSLRENMAKADRERDEARVALRDAKAALQRESAAHLMTQGALGEAQERIAALEAENDSWLAQVEELEGRVATAETQANAANEALLRLQGIGPGMSNGDTETLALPEGVEVGTTWRGKTPHTQAMTGKIARLSARGKVALQITKSNGAIKRGDVRHFDAPMFVQMFERQEG